MRQPTKERVASFLRVATLPVLFATRVLEKNTRQRTRCLFWHGRFESVIYHRIRLPVFTGSLEVGQFEAHLFIRYVDLDVDVDVRFSVYEKKYSW